MALEPLPQPMPPLEQRLIDVGRGLDEALARVLAALPEAAQGPQRLADALGLDKVLASRLLKASRSREPVAVAYHMPGPEPLRRFLRAARRRGVDAVAIAAAEGAVARFQALVRSDVGDRSALDAVVAAWLPEARAEFELRRKQSAYRALSQLKGVSAQTLLATSILHPAQDGTRLDVVWICGLLGLRRLRPGANAKLTTRRITGAGAPRQPTTLDGRRVEGLAGLRLDAFCDAPPARLEVRVVGDTVHYLLGGEGFGTGTDADLVFAEANFAEMPRYVPAGSGRKGYVFAEVSTPARTLLFDVLVHEQVYPGSIPSLLLYDTAFEGVVDVNDRARDADLLDLDESIQSLGRGTASLRARAAPRYVELLRHVFERTGWDPTRFSAWRCQIDYPLYGCQVVAAFDPPER